MIMVAHPLIAEQFDLEALQTLVQNPFQREKVTFFAENVRSEVAAVGDVIQSASFVGSGWSWHLFSLRGCEKMGLAPSGCRCFARISHRCEVPVPIFSQPLPESSLTPIDPESLGRG